LAFDHVQEQVMDCTTILAINRSKSTARPASGHRHECLTLRKGQG